MKAQDVLGSPFFVGFGIWFARTVPRRMGYWTARRLAHNLARRRTNLYSTLYANLRQVVGAEVGEDELARMAEEAIFHAGCTYYDMFRGSIEDLRRGKIVLHFDEAEWQRTLAVLSDERGTILVGPHLSNFDLAAQWIISRGFEMQALSLASPDLGDRTVNVLRRHRGVNMTPIDMRSLRSAMQRLKAGGLVLTGVDRPVSDHDEPLTFFGAPARLPVGHIRLALQTDARVLVASCTQDDDGVYAIHFAPPMEMENVGSREEAVVHNASRVLRVIEEMIRLAPSQWLMFVPVWPEESAPRETD